MSKKASSTAIGGFVLGAIALLIAAIVAFSSGNLLREKTLVVSYFPGTVAGLSVGAPVQFQGVQIGQVTDITLDFYRSGNRFQIPVQYEIWADAVRLHDSDGVHSPGDAASRERISSLVEDSGLRALLTSASLVTGQYLITLDLQQGSDFKYRGSDDAMPEIPTLESTRDKVSDMVQRIELSGLVTKASDAFEGISELVNSDAVRKMPGAVDTLLGETQDLVVDLHAKVDHITTGLDATLSDYRTLATTATARIDAVATALEDVASRISTLSSNLNAQVDPVSRSAIETMGSVRKTMESYEAVVDPQAATMGNLDQMLEEAAGAARALRILADYLEQNPDALIKGKY